MRANYVVRSRKYFYGFLIFLVFHFVRDRPMPQRISVVRNSIYGIRHSSDAAPFDISLRICFVVRIRVPTVGHVRLESISIAIFSSRMSRWACLVSTHTHICILASWPIGTCAHPTEMRRRHRIVVLSVTEIHSVSLADSMPHLIALSLVLK